MNFVENKNKVFVNSNQVLDAFVNTDGPEMGRIAESSTLAPSATKTRIVLTKTKKERKKCAFARKGGSGMERKGNDKLW